MALALPSVALATRWRRDDAATRASEQTPIAAHSIGERLEYIQIRNKTIARGPLGAIANIDDGTITLVAFQSTSGAACRGSRRGVRAEWDVPSWMAQRYGNRHDRGRS